jgi:hypothetical protein
MEEGGVWENCGSDPGVNLDRYPKVYIIYIIRPSTHKTNT